ncbi:MAG: outer membrane beta-barrel protein [Acidobacteriota bacterium]|nr:outer membrane beta-barrel protein [Acidobacteriota bacterium]
MTIRIALSLALLLIASTTAAQAQSVDLSAHVVGANWSEFEGSDFGIGGRLSWKAGTVLGVEGEVNWFPAEFPGENVTFSGNRLEGVVAITAGPRIDRIRPFVRLGAGFLRSSPAPAPFACIAIFPPPLHCLLAAGDTMPSVEIGGGVEVSISARTFLRFDAVDRILRYPGPTFGPADEISEDGFFGHAFKFTLGVGWRF